jgi:hypothetical protein
VLADAIEKERQMSRRELHELRVEAAKLSSAVAALHDLASERGKILDLPALPLRRDVN